MAFLTGFGDAVDDGALGGDVLGLVEVGLDHFAGLLGQIQRKRQVCARQKTIDFAESSQAQSTPVASRVRHSHF